MAVFVGKMNVLHDRTYFALLHTHWVATMKINHNDRIRDVLLLIIKSFVFVLYVIKIIVEDTGIVFIALNYEVHLSMTKMKISTQSILLLP